MTYDRAHVQCVNCLCTFREIGLFIVIRVMSFVCPFQTIGMFFIFFVSFFGAFRNRLACLKKTIRVPIALGVVLFVLSDMIGMCIFFLKLQKVGEAEPGGGVDVLPLLCRCWSWPCRVPRPCRCVMCVFVCVFR